MSRAVALIAASVLFAASAIAADAPRQVVLTQHGHGATLADDKGMTLYTYEKDELGKSTCVGACAKQWPPLLVTADADRAGGAWSIITREDGAKQWAFYGKPLYYYSNDAKPGETNGDGAASQWQIAFQPIPLPPGLGIQRTRIGYVLNDPKKMTLYSLDRDKVDGSACDSTCTRTWMPLWAPTVAHGFGDWSVISRKDGTRQWAFKGKPVYRYAHDAHPAETSGENVEKKWHAVVLEPLPPNPTWITIQRSDQGELLADARGRTLYIFDPTPRIIGDGRLFTPAFDNPEDWVPFLAAADAKAVGYWSVIAREGKQQWSYKGLPIYTNVKDKVPGDLFGSLGGGRARVRPILLTATGSN